MKNLVIILFLIVTCIKSLNAVEKNVNELDSMLQQNFKLYLIEDRRCDSIFRAHLDEANKIENPSEFKYINDIYFSTLNYPPGFEFKDTINGIKVYYIDLGDYMSLKQILKKSKPVMSLSAIIMEKNRIRFNYTLSGVKLLNKYQYFETVGSWFHCIYEYDCERKRWILLESKRSFI